MFAAEMRLQVVQGRLRVERDVRRQQHVVAPDERMMPEIRGILRQHVEGGPAQEAAIERLREVGLDDERAARDVDEQRLLPHLREGPAIEQAAAAGIEVAVQGDDVGAREEIVEPRRLGAVAAHLGGIDARVRGEDGEAEARARAGRPPGRCGRSRRSRA